MGLCVVYYSFLHNFMVPTVVLEDKQLAAPKKVPSQWQQFQVEINSYIDRSTLGGHRRGEINITTINGSSWEYSALSAESLASSLRNKTIYISGDSTIFDIADLLLLCLDHLCINGLEGNPNPAINVKSMLDNEELYSGTYPAWSTMHENLWGSGEKQFNRCFFRDKKKATKKEDVSFVTVKHSFYYKQRDSVEEKILARPVTGANANASANAHTTNHTDTAISPATDIAILNFAVAHRLHLFPIKNGWNTEMVIANLGPSIRFEEQIQKTVNLASEAGARCIILKTMNPICESEDKAIFRLPREFYRNLEELSRNGGTFDEEACYSRIDKWKDIVPDYHSSLGNLSKTDLCNTTALRSKRSELEAGCVGTISNQLLEEGKGDEYNAEEIQTLCSYKFSQTNVGIESRRDQVQHFVQTNQERYLREHNVKVIFFDWYKIVKDHDNYCQYTKDTVHYGSLLPLQLKFITNIIGRHCSSPPPLLSISSSATSAIADATTITTVTPPRSE